MGVFLITTILIINALFPYTIHGHANHTPPLINSESAIVIDAKTGTIIYEKNAQLKMYPASLTKIATAIYAIENGDLDDVVTVSKNARGTIGSSVYLVEGEKVSLKKLLQGLLINSGNDAGVAIAEHLSGNLEQFSTDINEYLRGEIGVYNTNFENPHGLFDPKHVTTTEDLAKITQYAIENEEFKEIFGTTELAWDGEDWDTTLYKHHKLMREMKYEGVTGGKTGYVEQSGFTLATTAERDNLSLVVITLNSNLQQESYNDTINLLDYTFENFQTSRIPADKAFEVEGLKYKASKDIFYTHQLDQKVNEEVSEDGTLNIIDQEVGTVISSFQLDKVLEKEKTEIGAERVSGVEKTDTLSKSDLTYWIFTALILFAIANLFYRYKRRIL